jgi:hypothetical protein
MTGKGYIFSVSCRAAWIDWVLLAPGSAVFHEMMNETGFVVLKSF